MRIRRTARSSEAPWGRIAIATAFAAAFWASVFWPSSPVVTVRVQETKKIQVERIGPKVAKWTELTDLGRKIPRGALVGEEEVGGDKAEAEGLVGKEADDTGRRQAEEEQGAALEQGNANVAAKKPAGDTGGGSRNGSSSEGSGNDGGSSDGGNSDGGKNDRNSSRDGSNSDGSSSDVSSRDGGSSSGKGSSAPTSDMETKGSAQGAQGTEGGPAQGAAGAAGTEGDNTQGVAAIGGGGNPAAAMTGGGGAPGGDGGGSKGGMEEPAAKEVPNEPPAAEAANRNVVTPAQSPKEAPKVASVEASTAAPMAAPAEALTAAPAEALTAAPAEALTAAPAEAPDNQELVSQPAQSSGSSSDGDGSSTVRGPCCPPLSKELLQKHAKNNTVMLGVMNREQQDFGRNWLHHVRALNLSYYVIGATDANTSVTLTELKVPCFDLSEDSKSLLKLDPTHALEWGAEGWRRMTWHKVFVLDKVADWGFNVVMSDMDVTWLRDPLPLFAKHPHAEIIFSADGVNTGNQPGDEGLDQAKDMFENFNTGVYLLRYGPNTSAWAHAWRALFDSGFGDHDQHGAYQLTRKGSPNSHPLDPRVRTAFDGKLWIGIMPPSLFSNTHSYYVQRLHQEKKVQPYEVHYTWSYNGRGGKLFRARDAMLWRDPPSYYSEGNFVTVDLRLPKTPLGYNEWTENEQMISYHLSQVQAQLFQSYIGIALAVASGRAFISPKITCYCDKIYYAVNKCRMLDNPDLQLPFTCPTDYIFKPDQFRDGKDGNMSGYGTPIDFRENSFLDNPLTPAAVKDSVLVIQPSDYLTCSDCVQFKEVDGKKVLQVPANLKDRQLLPLLKPYEKYRVWKLNFDGVQLPVRGFGGFACAGAARDFDTRMARITGDWCCRYEEEAKGYGKQDELVVPYRMGSIYSQKKDLDGSC